MTIRLSFDQGTCRGWVLGCGATDARKAAARMMRPSSTDTAVVVLTRQVFIIGYFNQLDCCFPVSRLRTFF